MSAGVDASTLALPIFDHHVHLDDPLLTLPGQLDFQWRDAAAAGLCGAVTAGYGPERDADAIAALAPGRPLWRAVGLHPWWLAAAADDEARHAGLRQLERQLSGPGVVALGEVGLDGLRKQALPIAEQRRWMARALGMARAFDLPVVLHVVRAIGHALEELRACPPPGGVVHRFGGPAELAPALCALGLAVSLDPSWLRRPDKLAAVVHATPPGRLLVESDWPLDDRPWSAALQEVQALVAAIAALRGEPVAAMAARLVEDAQACYRLG